MTLLYNGVQYEIEEEGEVEQINIGGEIEFEDEDTAGRKPSYRESAWEPHTVHLFLNECVRRKNDLQNPRVRRRRIFSDIRERMRLKGYNFRIESLDRKLRNMKIHYVLSNSRTKSSFKRSHWPYYDKLKILYPNATSRRRSSKYDNEQEADTNMSTVSCLPAPAPVSHLPPPELPYAPSPPPPSHSPVSFKIKKMEPKASNIIEQVEEQESPNDNFLEQSNQLERLRRDILTYEKRRTIAAENILKELREANRLKRELLELNISMFRAERGLPPE